MAEDCGRRIRVGARPKEAINYLEDYTEAENPRIQIAKGETGGRGDVSHIELGLNYLLSGQLDISEICRVLQRTLGRRSKSTFIHCIMVQRSINLYREEYVIPYYIFVLLDREECSNKGGSNEGTCASGFGVCCISKFMKIHKLKYKNLNESKGVR